MMAIKSSFIALVLCVLSHFLSNSCFAGGALCLYQLQDGTIVCSSYSNSGLPAEIACASEARTADPVCGLDIGAINIAAGSCASSIFGQPNRCLDDAAPHNHTGSTNQTDCEAAGDRWCPSTYYGFFVGNSGCQDAICNAAQGILPAELIEFKVEWDDGYNHVSWSTASEYNTSHFVITHYTEVVGDGYELQFTAAGTSSELQEYNMRHKDPEKTINYYVLDQVDIDGARTQYGPISIDNSSTKRKIVQKVDMIGQEIDEFYQGIVIVIYDDGTTEKIYQR